MEVLLIEPPHKFWPIFKFHTAAPGLAALAAFLQQDFKVKVLDLAFLPDPWSQLKLNLKEQKPDLIGITCAAFPHFYDALQVAAFCKLIYPEIPVIGGGTVFTALSQAALSTGNLDFIVMNEGELSSRELFLALSRGEKDFSAILGIAYLKEGQYALNSPRPFIADLNTLPAPAWQLFPMDAYQIKPLGGKQAFALTNSRGCGNKCTYCSETAHWKSEMRLFSGERTALHLEELVKKYHKKVFIFGDNDFLWDKERVLEFCRVLAKKNLKAQFWLQATVKNVIANAETLPALKKAGCFNFQLGIESISPPVQEAYQKIQSRELILQAVKLLRKAGISVTGLYMWGDWLDSPESLKEGLNFILKYFDFWAPNILNPFPQTPYYEKCRAEGRIKEWDLRRYNQYHIIMPLKELSRYQAQKFYQQTAFSWPVALGMLKQALFSPHKPNRSWAREFILLDIKYNLFPWVRKPGGKSFRQYFREKGRELPAWEIKTPPWNIELKERPEKIKKMELK